MTLLVWIALICQPLSQVASAVTLELQPEEILIGATYTGSSIVATGEIPVDSEVAVLLIGGYEDISLKKKGKALGLLWMNMGKVVIHNIPSVYLLYTAKSIEDLNGAEQGNANKLEIGFPALEKAVTITSEGNGTENTSELFAEFLKLKSSEDLYAFVPNGVSYQAVQDTVKSFSASVAVSPRLKQGQYDIRAYVIKDGAIVDQNSKILEVKEVGFPAFISRMAYEQSALYGVLAAAIAIAAGLFMGLIFSKNPRK